LCSASPRTVIASSSPISTRAAAARVAAAYPSEAVAVGGDVADETDVTGHLDAALSAFGRLDRLVCWTEIYTRPPVCCALGHPTRLGIVRRLAAEGEICACDFTEHFGVSQPTISGHLKTLRTSGVVRSRRRGTQICYSLHPTLADLLRQLAHDLDAQTRSALT
jgi:ArsR family transcriptional regulator, arsenate/arsenite/antimonite-responsive transcriptional repressor